MFLILNDTASGGTTVFLNSSLLPPFLYTIFQSFEIFFLLSFPCSLFIWGLYFTEVIFCKHRIVELLTFHKIFLQNSQSSFMYLNFSISSHLIFPITVFIYVKLPFSMNQVYVLTGQGTTLLLFIFSLNSLYCLQKKCPLSQTEDVESERVLCNVM